ncbi:uncharacterized protein ASCRUDRAFT_134500 [Ascoidea rubescens DSM 1968]|uniref:Uncharacterized protein n=1 Tax=Ascoidea rubescens DSM 1968 TaxID=1344418 RepID=A0A1D2VL77_9ASCO|nr:hypothetical protein ASCRUDRAFT_134500 [Ascoidea rubescens DSM 1968]ODV62376.1 hypothetical protein ASCRUDRAFT_134500 [Ascoidea rubescens DSM 1968]
MKRTMRRNLNAVRNAVRNVIVEPKLWILNPKKDIKRFKNFRVKMLPIVQLRI